MEKRDDFEHRLGQGLKRWAGAGQPTLDLEAYVTGQVGDGAPGEAPEPGAADAPVPARPRRPWVRWAISAAAAVILLTGATFTFPAWAGTAAAWPLIGPVIQEMIMKDAGLKWAYDAGLIQGTVAEATSGEITVRVLAVVPDQAITTILYQITGLPEKPAGPYDGRPIAVDRGSLLGSLAFPVSDEPEVRVKSVPGVEGIFFSRDMPMQTPVGLFGTITTNAVEAEGGNIELVADAKGEKLELSFPVSRSASDKLTREYPVGQSRTIDEITYEIDAVLQTPVHTVIRYKETKPVFWGSYEWSNHEYSMALEAGNEVIYSTGDHGQGGYRYALFPKTKLPARLLLPASVKGAPVDIVWPLEPGAVKEIQGVPVTLFEWEIEGNQLGVSFHWPHELIGFNQFEALDGDGNAIPLKQGSSTSSTRGGPEHSEFQEASFALTFPEGAKPVAIRAKQVAVAVQGPWVFQLPNE
ncbi:MAG: polymerase ECF-type sigma factor variant [Symbiobacteriaceae bacterium]|jgi:hypothetical protein|nr:polymerase ECF-type sigma factor variant [Symbiobacteriaceae bacterium]